MSQRGRVARVEALVVAVPAEGNAFAEGEAEETAHTIGALTTGALNAAALILKVGGSLAGKGAGEGGHV